MRKSGTTENLTDMQMVGEEGWVAGFDGVILHTSDGGQTWSAEQRRDAFAGGALVSGCENGWAVGWAAPSCIPPMAAESGKRVKIPGGDVVAQLDPFPGREERFDFGLRRATVAHAGWRRDLGDREDALLGVADVGRFRRRPNRGWITTDDGFLLSEDGGTTWKLHRGSRRASSF